MSKVCPENTTTQKGGTSLYRINIRGYREGYHYSQYLVTDLGSDNTESFDESRTSVVLFPVIHSMTNDTTEPNYNGITQKTKKYRVEPFVFVVFPTLSSSRN